MHGEALQTVHQKPVGPMLLTVGLYRGVCMHVCETCMFAFKCTQEVCEQN